MKYQLLNNGRAVLIDRTPILTDVKGSAKLSFILPAKGTFCAVLIEDNGIRTQVQIQENGECNLPRNLYLSDKRQYLELYVIELDNNAEATNTWICEPLLISQLTLALKNQWQISGGMTEESALKRLTELEVKHDKINSELAELRLLVEKRIRRATP